MPAVRGKNLRSGDLAEQLGLLLLQSVALVAPIPRTEDIGIDAVVTLLRDFDSRRLIAEDSFFVQIKSSSVPSIPLNKEEVRWLYALDLPFFIASVDRSSSHVKLYCAHRLSDAFVTNHDRESLTIYLDDSKTLNELVEKDDPNVHIGPPVLEWSLATIANDNDFPNKFYEIAKEHIKIGKENIRTRDVGYAAHIRWQTNEPPQRLGSKKASSRSSEEDMKNAEEAMAPYFFVWHMRLMLSRKWTPTAQSILSLLEKIKGLAESNSAMPSTVAGLSGSDDIPESLAPAVPTAMEAESSSET
jgi:hypothetical protein